MSEKNLKMLGWLGTFLSVMMYVSYVPQIMGNLYHMGKLRTFKRKKGLSFGSSKLAGNYLWITCNHYGILNNLILKMYCEKLI